jgi:hypothetical protein
MMSWAPFTFTSRLNPRCHRRPQSKLMKNRLPEILLKLILFGAELIFVGGLGYLRVLNIGWLLFIYGLLLIPWILIHLGLLAVFIARLKVNLLDLGLYLIVHFFYLGAWLFQSDGGDSGGARWTVQVVFDPPSLIPFLTQWGDILFWVMLCATLIGYLFIIIRVILSLNTSLKNKPPSSA